jgi:hypothetical protein
MKTSLLARRRENVFVIRAHRVAGARVLLLWVVGLVGFLGGRLIALLVESQLPLVLVGECRLLPS